MTRFRLRPCEPGRIDKRTPAQKAANQRSFQIFQLRGLFSLAYRLSGERREQAHDAIDAELKLLGAEPEAERMKRKLATFDEAKFDETEIPF